VLEGILKVESELRRQGQELAVAWRRGKARYVLDSLSAETPARSAVLASMIHELLSRWDPLDGKWPVGFWRALVLRSEGWMTGEELEELTSLYKRKFGMSPPRPEGDRRGDQTSVEFKAMLAEQARLIQEALEAGEPIARKTAPPAAMQPSPFLRPRRAAL
jgi:hypothetical protein